jgi:hypothetical protein
MNYDLTIILSSALFWVYIDSVKLVSNERVINSALIHACISGIGNSVGLVMYPIIVYDYFQIVDNVPSFISNIALISFGYSFYDLYIGVRSKKMDNILHGFIFVSTYTIAYYYKVMSMPSINMITETSSIFLNLRPYKKKWIDIAFAVTFFIYRIILSPIFITMYIMNSNNTLKMAVLFEALLLVPLNVYWFSLIVKKMWNKKIEI